MQIRKSMRDDVKKRMIMQSLWNNFLKYFPEANLLHSLPIIQKVYTHRHY
jgi:hypothetical protein